MSTGPVHGTEESDVEAGLHNERAANIASENQPLPSYWDRLKKTLGELKPSQAYHNRQGLAPDSLDSVLHFADLIRTFFIPRPPQDTSPQRDLPVFSFVHFADLIRTFFIPRPPQDTSPQRDLPVFSFVNSATKLCNVGLKFKVNPSNCLLDVKFEKGELKIPTFSIYDTTKLLLRNLMALEVCHYPNDSYIIDYVFLMDFLIDTVEDVDLLVEQGIIVNWLGQSAGVTALFNNATTHISYNNANFYFAQVCHDLNEFHKVNWNRWKTILNREYFGNPWKTVSTYAAVTLLLLAGAQTGSIKLCGFKVAVPLHPENFLLPIITILPSAETHFSLVIWAIHRVAA
ncbi:hypothetical protein RJ639_031621 [Escallonia herrerae]|uniref:Uncharacterized protein n=1 Tax=Escallonia herrerae TaxID=1293975 RepID=A0AA88WZA9_9ASTE|nr:hypothetical protein RJ639_031621 [Escallonia herrerae]